MGETEGATCPFCGAAWSDAMLALLDRFTLPSGCACCGGAHVLDGAAPLPTEDLCCTACGRAIYRGFAPNQDVHS